MISPKSFRSTKEVGEHNECFYKDTEVRKSFLFTDTNRFLYKKELGEGAYGKVLLALDKLTGKEVAVKMVLDPEDPASLPDVNEIDILARFRHPNLLHLEDCIYDEQTKSLLIVLPKGTSLQNYIKSKLDQGKSLSLGKCKSILFQLASAIHFLHETNHYFHCDIKPGNVIIVDGEVKLADFGLSFPDIQVPSEETRCGTFGYGSPQTISRSLRRQYNDRSFHPFEYFPEAGETPISLIQSDIHALGSIMYEVMNIGQKLVDIFAENTIAEYQAILPKVQEMNLVNVTHQEKGDWEELRRLVLRMLQPSQANRMKSITEVFESSLFMGDKPVNGQIIQVSIEGMQIPYVFAGGNKLKKMWSVLFTWLGQKQAQNSISYGLQCMCLAMDLYLRIHMLIDSPSKIILYLCVCMGIATHVIDTHAFLEPSDWVEISEEEFHANDFSEAYLRTIGYLHGKIISDNICNYTDNAYCVIWYIKNASSDCSYVTKKKDLLISEFKNSDLSSKSPISLSDVKSYAYNNKSKEWRLHMKTGDTIKFTW